MGRREVKRETWRARGRVPYRCGRAFYYRMHLNTKRPGSSTTRTLLLWNLSDIPEGSCVTRDHPLLYGRVHFVHTVLFILFLYFFRQRHFSLFISFFFLCYILAGEYHRRDSTSGEAALSLLTCTDSKRPDARLSRAKHEGKPCRDDLHWRT